MSMITLDLYSLLALGSLCFSYFTYHYLHKRWCSNSLDEGMVKLKNMWIRLEDAESNLAKALKLSLSNMNNSTYEIQSSLHKTLFKYEISLFHLKHKNKITTLLNNTCNKKIEELRVINNNFQLKIYDSDGKALAKFHHFYNSLIDQITDYSKIGIDIENYMDNINYLNIPRIDNFSFPTDEVTRKFLNLENNSLIETWKDENISTIIKDCDNLIKKIENLNYSDVLNDSVCGLDKSIVFIEDDINKFCNEHLTYHIS